MSDALQSKINSLERELHDKIKFYKALHEKLEKDLETRNVSINTLYVQLDNLKEVNKIINEQKLYWEAKYATLMNSIISIYNNELSIKNNDNYLITKLEPLVNEISR